jgi:hypothetical protein
MKSLRVKDILASVVGKERKQRGCHRADLAQGTIGQGVDDDGVTPVTVSGRAKR